MKSTKKELKRMLDGMLFHCMELTEFMSEHNDDEYFNTEEGKKIRGLIAKICLYHSIGMLHFITEDIQEKKEEPKINFEDFLKRSIDGD